MFLIQTMQTENFDDHFQLLLSIIKSSSSVELKGNRKSLAFQDYTKYTEGIESEKCET